MQLFLPAQIEQVQDKNVVIALMNSTKTSNDGFKHFDIQINQQ